MNIAPTPYMLTPMQNAYILEHGFSNIVPYETLFSSDGIDTWRGAVLDVLVGEGFRRQNLDLARVSRFALDKAVLKTMQNLRAACDLKQREEIIKTRKEIRRINLQDATQEEELPPPGMTYLRWNPSFLFSAALFAGTLLERAGLRVLARGFYAGLGNRCLRQKRISDYVMGANDPFTAATAFGRAARLDYADPDRRNAMLVQQAEAAYKAGRNLRRPDRFHKTEKWLRESADAFAEAGEWFYAIRTLRTLASYACDDPPYWARMARYYTEIARIYEIVLGNAENAADFNTRAATFYEQAAEEEKNEKKYRVDIEACLARARYLYSVPVS